MAKVIIKGVPEHRDDGILRLHDPDDRTYVEILEDHGVGCEHLAVEGDERETWLVAVPADARVTAGELSDEAWAELFDAGPVRHAVPPGSVRFSRCDCNTRGVSHGVCCEPW